MIQKILLLLGIVILGLLSFVASRPENFKVSRSASMNAPSDRIEAEVIDFHRWSQWSPWAPLDPKALLTFSGADLGVGAVFHWAGNQEVGEGEMKITEYIAGERVLIEINFTKPFQASNKIEFDFKSEGTKTVVTWSMSGKNNFISKAMGLLINCDKMVGDKYEQGLSNLKKLVEAPSPL